MKQRKQVWCNLFSLFNYNSPKSCISLWHVPNLHLIRIIKNAENVKEVDKFWHTRKLEYSCIYLCCFCCCCIHTIPRMRLFSRFCLLANFTLSNSSNLSKCFYSAATKIAHFQRSDMTLVCMRLKWCCIVFSFAFCAFVFFKIFGRTQMSFVYSQWLEIN